MSLGHFNLHFPGTVGEACALGARVGLQGAFLAGGTELLVDLRSGRKTAGEVIALGGIPELDRIAERDGWLEVGATVSLARVAESAEVRAALPALAEAIEAMAGRQIRNRGTIGGNFCCGVPCSDTPPICCAAGARVVLSGPGRPAGPVSRREVDARAFVLAPRVTALEPGEILTAVRLPRPAAGSGAAYERFSLRRGSALAVASVAAWLRLEGERIAEARLVLGAVGPVPLFAEQGAACLLGERPSAAAFALAGGLAAEEAQPISDLRGSAGYRRRLVAVLAARALARAAARARGGAG